MPNNITDVDIWTPTITTVADGEDADETFFALPAQGLANRTKHIRKGVPGIAASFIQRCVMPATPVHNNNSRFTHSTNGNHRWAQSDITDSGGLTFEIGPLPTFGKIDRVAARVTGSPTHVGLPATMPAISFVTFTEGVSAYGSAVVDASASVGAYETPHMLEVTGLAHSIVAGESYGILITGETGANAIAGKFVVLAFEFTIIP